MIPNAGLDNVANYRLWGTVTGTGLSGSNPDASGTQWLAYAAISEDSAAPTATDTNIGAESMRTNATGGFTRTATAIRDAGNNRLGVSIERAYVFDITTALNLTKYGYVPLSSGGNFSWIDLFRADPNDPMSSPITLTVGNGDQVQLWQTFTLTVPWSVDLESFVITGKAGNDTSGTHDAFCGFYSTDGTLSQANNDGVADMLFHLWGMVNNLAYAVATPQTPSAARDTLLASTTSGQALGGMLTPEAYTPGNYYRDKTIKFTTAQANMTITGIALGRWSSTMSTNGRNGFKIVFDDPSTFVKDNLHELTLTFRVSWAEG